MEEMPNLVAELRKCRSQLSSLELTDGFAHDVVEALEYWCSLAERALAHDARVNYPERATGERLWLRQLEEASHATASPLRETYRDAFRSGDHLLELIRQVPLPHDGYLGILRAVRKHFEFLKLEYGYKVVKEEPTGANLRSGLVFIRLEAAPTSFSAFEFGLISEQRAYWIHDLLYLSGDARYKTIPYRLDWRTEQDLASWFAFVAQVLREYGEALLRGEVKAFHELKAAQEKRDQEYAREMEQAHG